MSKRKRSVRFTLPQSDERPDTDFEAPKNGEEQDTSSCSLLNDCTNTTTVTSFDLTEELRTGVDREADGIIPQYLANLTDDGPSDEDSSDDDHEDLVPDADRLQMAHKSSSPSTDEEQNDGGSAASPESAPPINGESPNSSSPPPAKRPRTGSTSEQPTTKQDAIAQLSVLLKTGETMAKSLQRVRETSTDEKTTVSIRNKMESALNVLREHVQKDGCDLGQFCKKELLDLVDKWQLCWGDSPAAQDRGCHGPFDTSAFLVWARARYFVQQKIGWVRPVGAQRWWRASDVFTRDL